MAAPREETGVADNLFAELAGGVDEVAEDGGGGGVGFYADTCHVFVAEPEGAETDAVGMGGGEDGVEEGAVVLQEFLVESRFVVECE